MQRISKRPSKHSFEGWYYRMTNPADDFSIAFIPGIAFNADDSHAFIQVIQSNGETDYVRFAVSEYHYQENPFEIRIGPNRFTADSIDVNLNGKHKIIGNIRLISLQKPQFKLAKLGLMGPFQLLPFLPCYHKVISLSHQLKGQLFIDGSIQNLDASIGYIESDRGTAFPKGYFWTQCNTFEDSSYSFSCAVAHIPIGQGIVGGYALLYTPNNHYNFTTWKGMAIKRLEFSQNTLYVQLKQLHLQLDLKIHLPDHYTSDIPSLLAPVKGAMKRDIKETLAADVEIVLWEKDFLLETIHGRLCAVEIIDIFELIDMIGPKSK